MHLERRPRAVSIIEENSQPLQDKKGVVVEAVMYLS